MYDLCVVGGGAAGISCAIAAGRLGLKVLLVDKNNKLGKKLYATGNGRCNLTNSQFDIKKHFNSSDNNYFSFISDALSNAYNTKEPNQQIIDYMDSIGISTINDNNYIYPSSAQASSVVWAMIDELKYYNIEILSNTEIINIEGKYPSFIIKSQNKAYKATQVVLSCGGAAYKSLGGTTAGYNLAKNTGHNIIPIRPCLCGFEVKEDVSEIAGVRAKVHIKLTDSNNNSLRESSGELQLTKQGLSGICIFEISSQVGILINKGITPIVNVSFFNNNDNLYKLLIDKIKQNNIGNRTVVGWLNGYVNDKIAQYVCNKHGIDNKQIANQLPKNKLLDIINELNSMTFIITNLYDMEQAQLTGGGVKISDINPNTMESNITEGLYIVGELLDIDGICGGYNLTFAMLTGLKAGKSIYDKNKSN